MAVITGMKNISTYLGISENTVRLYIDKLGLPVRKFGEAHNSLVTTTSGMLDEWVERNLPDPSKSCQPAK